MGRKVSVTTEQVSHCSTKEPETIGKAISVAVSLFTEAGNGLHLVSHARQFADSML